VIVCGHTDCGVMKGVLNPEALKPMEQVYAWLRHAQDARSALRGESQEPTPDFLLRLTEQNVREQLNNLRTHPTVAERLHEGALDLHGWVYHIGSGVVTEWDEQKRSFVEAGEVRAAG
jgi:carbonic anhydrase